MELLKIIELSNKIKGFMLCKLIDQMDSNSTLYEHYYPIIEVIDVTMLVKYLINDKYMNDFACVDTILDTFKDKILVSQYKVKKLGITTHTAYLSNGMEVVYSSLGVV